MSQTRRHAAILAADVLGIRASGGRASGSRSSFQIRTAEMLEDASPPLRAASSRARGRDPKYCAYLRYQVGQTEWFSENMI